MYTKKSIESFKNYFNNLEEDNILSITIFLSLILFLISLNNIFEKTISPFIYILEIFLSILIIASIVIFLIQKNSKIEPEKITQIIEYNWCDDAKEILKNSIKKKEVLIYGDYRKAYCVELKFLYKKIEEQKYINSQKIFNN